MGLKNKTKIFGERGGKGYRDNQKDDFLAISVIQTCIDVVPDFYHLPKTLQKR